MNTTEFGLEMPGKAVTKSLCLARLIDGQRIRGASSPKCLCVALLPDVEVNEVILGTIKQSFRSYSAVVTCAVNAQRRQSSNKDFLLSSCCPFSAFLCMRKLGITS